MKTSFHTYILLTVVGRDVVHVEAVVATVVKVHVIILIVAEVVVGVVIMIIASVALKGETEKKKMNGSSKSGELIETASQSVPNSLNIYEFCNSNKPTPTTI